jgi:hypothetical protein
MVLAMCDRAQENAAFKLWIGSLQRFRGLRLKNGLKNPGGQIRPIKNQKSYRSFELKVIHTILKR